MARFVPTTAFLKQVAAIAVTAALAVGAGLLELDAPLNNWLAEKRQQLAPLAPSGEIVVVEIDARSIDAIGVWPWPRDVHASIVDRLDALGAAEIALDIDFSARGTEFGDAALEDSLRRLGNVILAAFYQPAALGTDENHFNLPIDRFAAHTWPGTVNVRADVDGSIRNASFGELIDGIPTLSFPALLSGYSGVIGAEFRIDYAIDLRAIDSISAIDLINGNVDPARIAGRKVIVGATAIELRDFFEVPVYGTVPGAFVQAAATETLIQDRVMAVSGWFVSAAGLAVLAVFAVATARLRWRRTILLLGSAALGIEVAGFILQAEGAVVLETGLWLFAIAGFALVTLLREVDIRGIAAAAFKLESHNTQIVLQRVVEDSSAGIIVADETGRILSASDAVSKILALQPGTDIIGSSSEAFLPPPIAEALQNAVRNYPSRSVPFEVRTTNSNGDERILDVTVTASALAGQAKRGGNPPIVACATFVDVTEERKLAARTEQLAWTDSLTGLPNRNYFNRALTEPQRRSGGALIFFDLDRFKNVNDTLGHRFGDLLLVAVADRVKSILDRDDLLARIGGDEFAILAFDKTVDETTAIAERVVEALAQPFDLQGFGVAIGASAGIASLDDRQADHSTSTRQADLALHHAKRTGGSVCVFDSRWDADLDRRRRIEVALWDALGTESVALCYQPQVDLATGHIVGAEALSRWSHPELGQVSPALFVPIAETSGLIERFGSQTLTRACQEMARCPNGGKVAVNVSPRQFVRGDLVRDVDDALSLSGLDPARLELEITESLFLHNSAAITRKMSELIDMGLSFALDDFGTGYSSLSYVRDYPIEKIKIDRSFVSRLPHDLKSAAIISAVVAMANSFGKCVIAEGVETEEQRVALLELGVTHGQGYLFGKATGMSDYRRGLFNSGRPLDLMKAS